MKTLREILCAISMITLLLTGVGMIVYYGIEVISSFFISTINMVVIGDVFWKIILGCFGSAVCSFGLACLIDKK